MPGGAGDTLSYVAEVRTGGKEWTKDKEQG